MRYSLGYFEVNDLVDSLKSNGITPLSVTHRSTSITFLF